jgi:large subunit ribosomal protein L9
MKAQQVLLREHVPSLGRCGEVVKVAPGFARNYLFPKRLAIEANADNIRAMSRRAERLAVEESAVAEALEQRVKLLAGTEVRTRQRADEGGHLYGSVTAHVVADLMTAAGHPIEERQVRLDAPLRAVGSHEVVLRLGMEYEVTITVHIEAE